eukprot:1195261-Prorocentrum_minimum.AAC.3
MSRTAPRLPCAHTVTPACPYRHPDVPTAQTVAPHLCSAQQRQLESCECEPLASLTKSSSGVIILRVAQTQATHDDGYCWWGSNSDWSVVRTDPCFLCLIGPSVPLGQALRVFESAVGEGHPAAANLRAELARLAAAESEGYAP